MLPITAGHSIVIRTHHTCKTLYITVFLLIKFGSDYYICSSVIRLTRYFYLFPSSGALVKTKLIDKLTRLPSMSVYKTCRLSIQPVVAPVAAPPAAVIVMILPCVRLKAR